MMQPKGSRDLAVGGAIIGVVGLCMLCAVLGGFAAFIGPLLTVVNISGTYDVSGVNQDGSTYSGTAVITHIGGKSYDFTWTISGQSLRGVGTLNDGVIIVDDGEFINRYHVLLDGTLDGTWTQRNVAGVGTEVLTPAPAAGASNPSAMQRWINWLKAILS